MTIDSILKELYRLGNPETVHYKQQKFGVVANNSLGIYHKDLNLIAKTIKNDTSLALALFDSGIYEARLLCSKIMRPKDVTNELAEKWVSSFENWEICDSFCMGLIAKSKFAETKIWEWAERKPEFEKRAAFATLAAYCMANKSAENSAFTPFFELIKQHATDERLYVWKAANWALRNIGKRNTDLQKLAITTAKEIKLLPNSAAQKIACGALKELQLDNCRISDYPRSIYRP